MEIAKMYIIHSRLSKSISDFFENYHIFTDGNQYVLDKQISRNWNFFNSKLHQMFVYKYTRLARGLKKICDSKYL